MTLAHCNTCDQAHFMDEPCRPASERLSQSQREDLRQLGHALTALFEDFARDGLDKRVAELAVINVQTEMPDIFEKEAAR